MSSVGSVDDRLCPTFVHRIRLVVGTFIGDVASRCPLFVTLSGKGTVSSGSPTTRLRSLVTRDW